MKVESESRKSLGHVLLSPTPWTVAHEAPLSLGFSRQEYWSGLLFPSPMHESEVAQSCPTLHDPTDCSLPGSSAHGIFQARVLEWGAIGQALNTTKSTDDRDTIIDETILTLRQF